MLTQLAIVVVILGFWELGARIGWVDPFYWSYPSQIWAKFVIFVATGQALADTSFTFQSTMLGFVLGTLSGTLIGLSFWWSRNFAALAQRVVVGH